MKLGKRIFAEDDADRTYERVDEAWKRLFDEELNTKLAIESYNTDGDEALYLMPNGHIVVISYPGNSAIYENKP